MGAVSVRAFNYVQSFSCLAERCEDTCCKDWRISISERDRGVSGQAQPLYENLIVKDAGGYQIAKKPDGHCVALEGGRCKVHAQYGEQALSNICANFPRMFRLINGSLVKSASMGCPEITRLCLFGDNPFHLNEIQQDDFHLADANNQAFEGLGAADWYAVVNAPLQLALAPELSAEQALMRVFDLASRLAPLPHSRWVESLPVLMADYRQATAQESPLAADPLLTVLMDILHAPNVMEALPQRVLSAIAGETPEWRRAQLQPVYRDLYRADVRTVLEPILKRFIAAEMTRTGFPFISTSSAGQDYGLNLVEWGATLAIRTLTLRYLLLAHCDLSTQRAPARGEIVELVYRFCRAASHSVATASEKALRQAISEGGDRYLAALIGQLPTD